MEDLTGTSGCRIMPGSVTQNNADFYSPDNADFISLTHFLAIQSENTSSLSELEGIRCQHPDQWRPCSYV